MRTDAGASRQLRAGIYARISQDRDGNRLGVKRQLQDCERLCNERGWIIEDRYVDNDVSASSGKRRPEYERVLADVATGRLTAVVVWDLDRLTRRPVELESFIGLAERHGLALASVGGDADLSTDNGRLYARIKGAVARAEVERKSARITRAHLQAAQEGRWRGGGRPYGYAADATTVIEEEAKEIRMAADAILAGASLWSIIQDLNTRGALSARGNPWNYSTLRQVLQRPRNIGLAEYRGEIMGPGEWPAVLEEETWRAMCAILQDPTRRLSTTNRVKWMLAGIALCGVCEVPLKSGGVISNPRTRTTRSVYRCANSHVARTAHILDAYVTEVMIELLSRPDAAELIREDDPARPDATVLKLEANTLRQRLNDAATDYTDQLITRAQLHTITERGSTRLTEIERQLTRVTRSPVLAKLVTAQDIRATWDGLPLDRKRAAIRAMIEIRVDPAGRRGRVVSAQPVRVVPR